MFVLSSHDTLPMLTACDSWGQSAGAISVALHMVTNNGNTEGLFHAGIMVRFTSIGPVFQFSDALDSNLVLRSRHPVLVRLPQSVAETRAKKNTETEQPFFDEIVQNTGCAKAADKLHCLRGVPFDAFLNATNKNPGLFSYEVGLSYPLRVIPKLT